jgi:hypothetical protein
MVLSRGDLGTWAAVTVGVIVIGAVVLVFALHKVIGPGPVAWVINLLTIFSSLTCAVLCGLLWHHFRKGEILKKIWGSLWIGLMLWATAEILYAFYDLSPWVEEPYPSLADAFFVPGFIPMFLALIFRYASLRVTPPRKLVIISGAAFGAVAAFWLLFVLGPIIESPGAGSRIEQLLDIYYPLADLLVVMGALLSMLALVGGQLSLPWGAIALACLTLAFSDSLYSYATWKDIYQPESGTNFVTTLCDTTYITGYIILAFGLYVQARLQRIL